MVAAACDHVTGGAAGQLVEVGLGDVRELKAQFAGELSHVPEHIAQLQLERLAHLRRKRASLIAQHLLHLVGHLTSLTAEAEGGIDRIGAHIGVAGRAACTLLIDVEIHWQSRAGGLR